MTKASLNVLSPVIIFVSANLMLSRNILKITDFGLSKIRTYSDDPEIEIALSTPGAGTCWYLPPECYEIPALICSKVDVWSAGIIFFQMLYESVVCVDFSVSCSSFSQLE